MINYNFEYSKSFKKSLSKLDIQIQKQIKSTVIKFITDSKAADFTKLQGHENLYRIRSGNYRILLEKYDNRLLILFVDVKHRREAYKDL